MSRPYLLITNDDGIGAPGLRHLWEALHEVADLAIVAPVGEKSGCGLSITWMKPLHVRQFPWEMGTPAWSLTGTPADCVKMALSVLLPKRPHLIVSGINRGSNAGKTVLYSGTVGGVIEGALKGIPGIAFSFSDNDPPPLQATKGYLVSLVKHFLEHPLPPGSFLNVNFPYRAEEKIAGFRFAKQGRGYWVEAPDKRTHPEGFSYYWLGGKWHAAADEDPESDVALLEQGFITGVPIHIGDLTDHAAFKKHKKEVETLFEIQAKI